MDLRVTHSTSLILRGLVVTRPLRPRRVRERDRVARQAQEIHIARLQHVRVRPAVRRVTRNAAFGLHRLVLVHERPLLVLVALVANRALRR